MSTGVLTLAPHIVCHSGTYDYKFTQGCKTTIYELKMHHYSLLVHWIISESSVNVSSHGLLLTSSAIFENTNVVLVLYELVGTCTVLFSKIEEIFKMIIVACWLDGRFKFYTILIFLAFYSIHCHQILLPLFFCRFQTPPKQYCTNVTSNRIHNECYKYKIILDYMNEEAMKVSLVG